MYVSLAEVKQWFEATKLVTGYVIDPEQEATASTFVLSRLQDVYSTATWIDNTNTPPLVRKIISMLVAAWYYQRTYSDDADLSNYGIFLERKAYQWLEDVSSGELDLPGITPTDGVFINTADFWPNDTTYGPVFLMDPAEQPF